MVGSSREATSRGNFSLPSGPNFHHSQPSSSSKPSKKKNWSSRGFSFRSSSRPNPTTESGQQQQAQPQSMARQQSRTASSSNSTASTDKWWKMRLFQGMVKDIRRRAPYYWSDWADAWDYRVVPATVYMYFAKYDPENATIFSYPFLALFLFHALPKVYCTYFLLLLTIPSSPFMT
jgi:hypothetical protein